MTGFRTREVAELVGMSPPQVRAYARTGILRPARGPHPAYYFTFHDLVLLRTAKRLEQAQLPAARVRRVLYSLTRQLPDGRSLTEVTITANYGRVLVEDEGQAWNPESEQLVFGLSDRAPTPTSPLAKPTRPHRTPEGATAEGLFQMGCELEPCAPAEAREAYHKALEIDPQHPDAHVNLGRLDQDQGDYPAAQGHYHAALEHDPSHVIAHFNLGSVLEHQQPAAAITEYQRAIELDPTLAEAHYRLAILLEQAGRELEALRHLKQYRFLVKRP